MSINQNDGYLGNPLLKNINTPVEWTEELLSEFVKCKNDITYFAEKYIKIVHVDRGFIPIELYDYQKDIIQKSVDSRRVAANLPRQSGKTVTAVVIILHYILFNTHKSVGVLANKGDTAREILDRIKMAYEALPQWLQQGIKLWNKGSIELENGCKIIAAATSSSAIRGKSLSLVYLDEVAFIENWDEFFASVYPTISSGKTTKIIATSCVTKDTLVWTDNGLQSINDFIDYSMPDNPNFGYEVSPYKVLGNKSEFNEGNVIVNSGLSKVNHIKGTFSEIKCSPNHKLWACKSGKFGWFKSEELQEGDFISIRYGMNKWIDNDSLEDIFIPIKKYSNKNYFIKPDKMNPDLAYLLGLYLAEGNMSEKYGYLDLTCGDDISKSIESVNLNYTLYDGIHYKISSTTFVKFMIEMGFDPSRKAKNKIIPNRITKFSKENIAAFISGMFDGDGTSNIKNGRTRVSYYSTSEKLIDQLRVILMNFGILSNKTKSITKPTKLVRTKSVVYSLSIHGDYAELFMKDIGFRFKRKQDNYIKNSKTRNSRYDILPYFFENYLDYGLKGAKYQLNNNSTHLSRQICLKKYKNNIPENILDENLMWDKIKLINEIEDYVYDFSLNHNDNDPWCHSVLYNGIVGHQTPKGINHWYYICKGAEEGINGYAYVKATWRDVPGRDEAWKEDTLAGMNYDLQKFQQEFEGQFLGSSGTLINGASLRMLNPKIPIHNEYNLSVYEKPIPKNMYVIIADVSRGKGLDYSAFQVIDISAIPYRQVAVFRDNLIAPMDYAEKIYQIAKIYNDADILVENNDLGQQVADSLHYDFEANILSTQNNGRNGKKISGGFGKQSERGIRTTKSVKAIGCSILKLLIEQNKLIIVDEETISELSTFSKKGTSYEAESGKHDDLVMGLVLFSWLSDQNYFKENTDLDTMAALREKTEEQMMNELVPFGFNMDEIDEFGDIPDSTDIFRDW